MKELIQVKRAVLEALNAAGVTAMEAFPHGAAKAYSGAVVTAAVGAAQGKTVGFCNYLGTAYDQETGTVRELYGKLLEGDIALEVRAQKAADCEEGCQKTAEVLLCRLPSGIRPGELCWDAAEWERTTGMFLRKGRLSCQAVFVAESQDEGETFLDFILKGEMQV